MQKYEVRLNLKPTIHDKCMQYHWQILLINDDGTFTIKDGWNQHIADAMLDAASAATILNFGW